MIFARISLSMEYFPQDVFGWFKIAYDKKKMLDLDLWGMGPWKMSHNQCNNLNIKWRCLLTKIQPPLVLSPVAENMGPAAFVPFTGDIA